MTQEHVIARAPVAYFALLLDMCDRHMMNHDSKKETRVFCCNRLLLPQHVAMFVCTVKDAIVPAFLCNEQ